MFYFKNLQQSIVILIMAVSCVLLLNSCTSDAREGNPRILVFSKTKAFKHASIPNGIAALQKLGLENGFEVDTTTNGKLFTDKVLDKYGAILFLNTTGDVLNSTQEIALERYIQSGGGFVGVHAASDTEYGWHWYGKLVGAYFTSHPAIQDATYKIKDNTFPATAFFKDSIWTRKDEIYNFKNINPDVHVLITVDESTYKGGSNGDVHPISWYHNYDGGRSFFTALGHTEECYTEEKYLKHLLGGIKYAMGENKKLDRSLATSAYPPDGSRFLKNTLSLGEFYEPTEMTILPNNVILIAERRGRLWMYQRSIDSLFEVGYLDVYFETNIPRVNAEEGLMGLQKDPNFQENHWVYVYYSPAGDEWVNRLSRFKFEDDTLQMDTEQIILDVESQRNICCHTGGSIAFGGDGLLYLSTGDNSTPFNEKGAKYVNDGYAPLNDLPGKQQYDARRSSGNTNDLRGKILRIRVNEDGSYDIPEGNLFPPGKEKTRPEIYTMGHRNPYRISVDKKNGWVYWGEVGPDARDDNFVTRGPKGYDEMGQAREAGNYGWPFFVADNKPYVAFDYATGISGSPYDPEKPINSSNNNTGLEVLPPAKPAYVYYPYVESSIWADVTSGGRNAMAGPTIYNDMYEGENELPDYYNGKVIIYDWMRGWMMAASFFEDGTFNKIEPFASDIELNNLIDMELGPDGTIYLLEYGTGWFTKNDDSGLSFISFQKGNMPPKIHDLALDKSSGQPPLTITAQVSTSDLEGEPITYLWNFGDGTFEESKDSIISHVYDSIGTFRLTVAAVDASGAKTVGPIMTIVSGNTRPEVTINLDNENASFFVAGKPIKYNVSVFDKEDSQTEIDESKIVVEVDYMVGFDEAMLDAGHQEGAEGSKGEALILTSTCKACHSESPESIGPNYLLVSEKYQDNDEAISYLQKKILDGGSGIWGDKVMPANSALNKQEAWHIAKYIMTLAADNEEESLPPKGTITPGQKEADKVMVVTAKYTDKGTDKTEPLIGIKKVMLKSSTVSLKEASDLKGFTAIRYEQKDLLMLPAEGGSFSLSNIDLHGIKNVNVVAGWQGAPTVRVPIEIRLNAPNGKVIGKGTMPIPEAGSQSGLVSIELETGSDVKAEKLYFTYKPNAEEKINSDNPIALVSVIFSGE